MAYGSTNVVMTCKKRSHKRQNNNNFAGHSYKKLHVYWVNLANGLKMRILFTIFCDRGHKVTYIVKKIMDKTLLYIKIQKHLRE